MEEAINVNKGTGKVRIETGIGRKQRKHTEEEGKVMNDMNDKQG